MAPLVLAYVYRGMHDFLENQYVFAAGTLWVMTLWLWAHFPSLGPAFNKNPDNTCYGLHYRDLSPQDHTFEACFRFFYSDFVSMGKGWMPFERDTVPSWLKVPPGEAGEEGDGHKEIWASFLMSRDLLFGLSAQSRNDKVGVEFYNAAQFARQFGLVQLIPIPPYKSLNINFTPRPVIDLKLLEQVKKDFDRAKVDFDEPYTEFPEKFEEFVTWWKGYITPLLSKSVGKVLKELALPSPPEPKKGSSKAKTVSATSSKRKGKAILVPPQSAALSYFAL